MTSISPDDPGTFENLLAWARHMIELNRTAHVSSDTLSFCTMFVNLLGEEQYCGVPEPLVKHGDIELAEVNGHYTPSEIRAMCAMWLIAADEAESIS